MKVKNELFLTLARLGTLNRLASLDDVDSEIKFHIVDLKLKIIEAEKAFLICQKELLQKFGVDGEVPVDNLAEADVEYKKLLNIEVELDHKMLVIPKLPKIITSNDVIVLMDLVKFSRDKKKKKVKN